MWFITATFRHDESLLPSGLGLTWWRMEGKTTTPRSWEHHPLWRTQVPDPWRGCWRMKAVVVVVPPTGLRLANASSEAPRCPRGVSWSRSRTLRLKSIFAWSPSGFRHRLRSETSDDSRRRSGNTRCWLLICWLCAVWWKSSVVWWLDDQFTALYQLVTIPPLPP